MLKDMARKILREPGLEVHRYVPSGQSKTAQQIVSSMRKFGIDLVLVVGANQAQVTSVSTFSLCQATRTGELLPSANRSVKYPDGAVPQRNAAVDQRFPGCRV